MPSGTLWKLEGTEAWFYSRNGAWRYPSTVPGDSPVPVDQLTVGHKYEVEFKPFRVTGDLGRNQYFDQDVREHGLEPSQRGQAASVPQQAPRPASAPTAAHRGTQGAEITATAIVKSCLEAGKDLSEAMIAGCRWSSLWHDLPDPVAQWWHKHDPAFAKKAPVAEKKEDLDDDIPF